MRNDTLTALWKVIQRSHGTAELLRLIEATGEGDFSVAVHEPHARSGDTAAHMAARHDRLDALAMLHDSYNLSLSVANLDGKTPLHEAASGGHLKMVEYLLARGVCVDALKRAGWTPLMMSCTRAGNLPVVRSLAEAGADLTLRNQDGWSALHVACRTGDGAMVTYLLERHPVVNVGEVSNNLRSPLHTAALHGRSSVVDILRRHNFPFDATDGCGSTPLMDAARSDDVTTIRACHVAAPSQLARANKLGLNCLHAAAEAGSAAAVRHLVENCACDVNAAATEGSGQTALHLAYREEWGDVVGLLLRLGADEGARDRAGRVPADMRPSRRGWVKEG